MRLLRRLEKNHDGIRSAATRQHYMQIYQAIKYLSLDVADFLEKGPQLAELPDVYKVGHTQKSARYCLIHCGKIFRGFERCQSPASGCNFGR